MSSELNKNAEEHPINNKEEIILSENQMLLIERFFPLAMAVARRVAGRDGDLDQIQSDAQWGLVLASVRFDGDPDLDRDGFTKYAMKLIWQEARRSRRLSGKIGNIFISNLSEVLKYDDEEKFIDGKYAIEIDRIVDEWGLQDLSECMSREEWAVVHDLVIGGLSVEESSARLDVTKSRIVELYNSAGDKIRSYYARCPRDLENRGR